MDQLWPAHLPHYETLSWHKDRELLSRQMHSWNYIAAGRRDLNEMCSYCHTAPIHVLVNKKLGLIISDFVVDCNHFFLTKHNQEPNTTRLLHCEICTNILGPVVYSRKFRAFAAECYLQYYFNEQVTAFPKEHWRGKECWGMVPTLVIIWIMAKTVQKLYTCSNLTTGSAI